MTTESRLRTLVALAATGSVRGAASRLTVTESAVSASIGALARGTRRATRGASRSRAAADCVRHRLRPVRAPGLGTAGRRRCCRRRRTRPRTGPAAVTVVRSTGLRGIVG